MVEQEPIVPALPGPVIKNICSFLPLQSRCQARLVCRAWRGWAGEAVSSIGATTAQLKKHVFCDYTSRQVQQQLRKAAAAEAAAAGCDAEAAAAAAASLSLHDYISSSSSSTQADQQQQQQQHCTQSEVRQRHAGRSSSSIARNTKRQQQQQRRAVTYSQHDLNTAGITALGRRIAAAFPAAATAVVQLEVGGYGPDAPPAPEVVASRLLLLLGSCKQLARLRVSITAKSPDKNDHNQHHELQGQQQQQQPAHVAAGLAEAAAALDDHDQQQQQPAAAGGVFNDNDDADSDAGLLGFDASDSDYCYGWIARLLQSLQQQQQQAAQSGSSSSSAAAAVTIKRQSLHPVLLWNSSDLQQQQQHGVRPWSEVSGSSSSSAETSVTGFKDTPVPPLVLEVQVSGAAYPSSSTDWLQLQSVSSAATLLLPPHRPPLLPVMVRDGLAGLTQLRALQLSVDGGLNAPFTAFHWGLGEGQLGSGGSSCITAISNLTRLTHLGLHTNGFSTAHLTAALHPLRNLRELLISGSSTVVLPLLATALTQLQLLVLQQQLGFCEIDYVMKHCTDLKYLEILSVWETAGAAQSLAPFRLLLPSNNTAVVTTAAAAVSGVLLGPAADAEGQSDRDWLWLPHQQHWTRSGGSSSSSSAGRRTQLQGLGYVAATYFADASGEAGKAAQVAMNLCHMHVAAEQLRPPPTSAAAMFAPPRQRAITSMDVIETLRHQTLWQLMPQHEQQQQQQQRKPAVTAADLRLLLKWWPALIQSQEELHQAVLQLALYKCALSDHGTMTHLQIETMREPTSAVSCLSLLQLVGSWIQQKAAAETGDHIGMMPVVMDDGMPAAAIEELLDLLFCAAPFDTPTDPTDDQQKADLAAEQAALSAWRVNRQLQGGAAVGAAVTNSAAGLAAASEATAEVAADAAAAAAAAAEPDAGVSSGSSSSSFDRIINHFFDDYALHLQQWLLERYSSSTGSSSSSSSAVNRLGMCASDGSDLSLLAESLSGLKSLWLSVPPCLEGFKASDNGGPVDVTTLPEMQLWMGCSGQGLGFMQSCGNDNSDDQGLAASLIQQHQQQQWQLQLLKHTVSFAGSFLNPNCYFSNLGVLEIQNLSRADGPWEPSAVLGDQVLAAVALGCPALKTLEVSGVLGMSGAGLLLLRRLHQLTKLRLEQWTNTAAEVSQQQLPVAVACLPSGLTSLALVNVEPRVGITPLAAAAAAVQAAGGVEGVRAAAEVATSAIGSSSSRVDIAAAAEAVLAAAEAAAALDDDSNIQLPPFLGFGVGCSSSSSSRERYVVSSRQWLPPQAIAVLLLDTLCSSSSGSSSSGSSSSSDSSSSSSGSSTSREDSVASALQGCCCSSRCCLHGGNCNTSTRLHVVDDCYQGMLHVDLQAPLPAAAAARDLLPSSSSNSCVSSCCVAGIFRKLEELTIVSHGPGFKPGSGGINVFLAVGLPHAKSLQRLHVSTPCAFSNMPVREAAVYGVASAATAATLHMFDAHITSLLGKVWSSGFYERADWGKLLNPMQWFAGGSSSNSSSGQQEQQWVWGSGSASSNSSGYAWLTALGHMPKLEDLHLDMPLALPGQMNALAHSVASSRSIRSLSMHGVALNLYSSHSLLLNTLSQCKPHVVQQQAGQAANAASNTSSSTSLDTTTNSNALQSIDLSFTKHCALAPAGLSLSRTWARVKQHQHDIATQQEVQQLQQIRDHLAQHHAAAVAAAAAGNAPNAAAAAEAMAAAFAQGVVGQDAEIAQMQQMFAAALMQGQVQIAPGAVGAEAVPNGVVVTMQQMIQGIDHQIHMLTHHAPPATRPAIMSHAAAASEADKAFLVVLRDVLRGRGVTDLSVRMHGDKPADRAGQHGAMGQGGGFGWGRADGVAANANTDSGDESDDDDCSTRERAFQELAKMPDIQLGLLDSSGIAGLVDGVGSGIASIVAFVLVWSAHGTGLALQQRSGFWGVAIVRRVLAFARRVFVAACTFSLACIMSILVLFASPAELERVQAFRDRITGAAAPGGEVLDNAGTEESDSDDTSDSMSDDSDSSWEEVSEVDDDSEQDEHLGDDEDVAAADAPGAAGGGIFGAMFGNGAGLGLPMLNPNHPHHVHQNIVEQGIQELLNPEGDGRSSDAADPNGGMTGVPSQVQVLVGLDSPASWGFVLGAAPLVVVGAWLWLQQFKFFLAWAGGVLRLVVAFFG